MELKDKKYINNTRQLPKFQDGFNWTPTDPVWNQKINYTPYKMPSFGGSTKSTGSSSSNGVYGADWGSAIGSTIGAIGSIYGAHQYDDTYHDLINKYGTSTGHYGDQAYTRYNDIDTDAESDIINAQNTKNLLGTTASGALAGTSIGTAIMPGVGSVIGGGIGAVAGFIGGWFGGKSRKRKAEEQQRKAQQLIIDRNDNNKSYAQTSVLQQKEAQRFGDTRAQQLFGYSGGKDAVDPVTGSTVKDHIVETSEGPKVDKQNSWVSEGESVWNPTTGYANYITHGPNDSARANLKDEDVVFGDVINPLTGKSFKTDAAPYIIAKEKLDKMAPTSKGWLSKQTKQAWEKAAKPVSDQISATLNNLAQIQQYVKTDEQTQPLMKAKYGKNSNMLPGFKNAKNSGQPVRIPWTTDLIPFLLGSGASLAQYFGAHGDKPYKPDTFVRNEYLQKGLRDLASLRISSYPIIQAQMDAEARANSGIMQSGGLSFPQKHLSRLASLYGTQQNIANALANNQAQNNAYAANAANAGLQYYGQDANSRMQALRHDLDYYTRAHAAQKQGEQIGVYNFLNNLNQYAANEFKRKSYNYMMNRYDQELTKDQQNYINSIGYASDPSIYNIRRNSIGTLYAPDFITMTPTLTRSELNRRAGRIRV